MRNYIIRRLLQSIPLLIVISMLIFFIMQLAPGDYLDQLRMNPDISKEMLDQLETQYGLDKPIYQQYFYWFWRVLHLDFGRSFRWGVPVSFILGTRMLNTLILSASAMFVTWIFAIPIGIYSATHRYKLGDNILTVFSFIGLSIPSFFFALLLLFCIVRFGINLPINGMTSIDYEWMNPLEKVIDLLRHLVVPTIVLGTGGMAGLMRQMRGQMIDAMRQDYIRTARSKGLAEKVIIYKHALRNAINPIITIFGFSLSGLLSGAAFTENVTGWPGLGQMMLQSVLSKDVYLAMAGFMMSSVLLIAGNILADVLLALTDPRIRYS